MEYQYIIALCLGIISVLISLRYMTITTDLYNEIKFIRSKCITVNKHRRISEMIYNIQKNHNLTLPEIKNLLLDRNSGTSRETYENYVYYDTKYRGLEDKDREEENIDFN